jgi:hypothetical protein
MKEIKYNTYRKDLSKYLELLSILIALELMAVNK